MLGSKLWGNWIVHWPMRLCRGDMVSRNSLSFGLAESCFKCCWWVMNPSSLKVNLKSSWLAAFQLLTTYTGCRIESRVAFNGMKNLGVLLSVQQVLFLYHRTDFATQNETTLLIQVLEVKVSAVITPASIYYTVIYHAISHYKKFWVETKKLLYETLLIKVLSRYNYRNFFGFDESLRNLMG